MTTFTLYDVSLLFFSFSLLLSFSPFLSPPPPPQVDSDDLPLNVSRETLQQHKLLKIIKKKLVRKALDMLKKMDEETYEKFWNNYSTHIKLGVVEDFSNKSRVAKLLRFGSSNDPEKLTSLDEYIERMKDKQEHIYYISGETRKLVCAWWL